jgi:serine/threonine protein kinase
MVFINPRVVDLVARVSRGDVDLFVLVRVVVFYVGFFFLFLPLTFQASRRREKEGKTFSLSPPSLFFLSFAAFFRCTGSRETQIPSVFKTKKKLKKTKQDPTHVYLALEFVRGGEFFRHLRARGRLPEAAARAYAAEVVVALEAMHDRGIVYRDLKVKKRVSRFS